MQNQLSVYCDQHPGHHLLEHVALILFFSFFSVDEDRVWALCLYHSDAWAFWGAKAAEHVYSFSLQWTIIGWRANFTRSLHSCSPFSLCCYLRGILLSLLFSFSQTNIAITTAHSTHPPNYCHPHWISPYLVILVFVSVKTRIKYFVKQLNFDKENLIIWDQKGLIIFFIFTLYACLSIYLFIYSFTHFWYFFFCNS